MNFYFRVDSNELVGMGHISRCVGLAIELEKYSVECFFISKNKSFVYPSYLPKINIQLIDADNMISDAEETIRIIETHGSGMLLVDSYSHDHCWEKLVKPYLEKVIVWDDLADREHACDVLIDCGAQRKSYDYEGLVSKKTQMLLGLKYCPISESFQRARRVSRDPKRIHLFLGSAVSNDSVANFYEELVRELPEFFFNVAFAKQDKVIGFSPRKVDTMYFAKPLSESMAGCVFAIGSPGTATWERVFLNIWGFYISTNKNQIQILKNLEELGFGNYCGDINSERRELVVQVVEKVKHLNLADQSLFTNNSVDGLGFSRICKILVDNHGTN